MRSCIHIYTGDGKGKTSASVGLAVRHAGQGGKVLFGQFLKNGNSGELEGLKHIPGITLFPCTEQFGFSFMMNDEQKKEAVSCYSAYLQEVLEKAVSGGYSLLILDEAIAAYNLHFYDTQMLLDFLENRPDTLEVVLTGRDPADELMELADYVSEIRKIKHPFDAGLPARKGIEW